MTIFNKCSNFQNDLIIILGDYSSGITFFSIISIQHNVIPMGYDFKMPYLLNMCSKNQNFLMFVFDKNSIFYPKMNVFIRVDVLISCPSLSNSSLSVVFISQLIRYVRACSSYECFTLRATFI